MHNPKPSSPRLRIAVVGAGGIGSTFALQLASGGGHDVTAVARPDSPRLKQLLRDGAIVKTTGERAAVTVADTLNETIAYDLVLVTLLAHQVPAVLPALQRSAARWIQFMFNNFEPETLRDAVGAERCSFGMPFVQASLDGEGRLNAKIGAGGQKSKMDSEVWVTVFNGAGLPAVFEPNMLLWLRCHAPVGAAFECVSVAGMRRGGGASWGECMVIAEGMQESLTMIRRLGYRLYPGGKAVLQKSPALFVAGLLWFVSRIRSFRELLATGANECCALIDVLVAHAPQAEPPVSVDKILAMRPAVNPK